MDAKKILLEILDYYKYKVENNLCSITEMDGAIKAIENNMELYGTIGKTTTGPEFLDTTIHEITHITQDIAHTDNIDPFGEDFAYLAGDISHEISDIVCEMSCPHCRCE